MRFLLFVIIREVSVVSLSVSIVYLVYVFFDDFLMKFLVVFGIIILDKNLRE